MQCAAVTTTVGVSRVPPQAWRWKGSASLTFGERASATCHGNCSIDTWLPPTIPAVAPTLPVPPGGAWGVRELHEPGALLAAPVVGRGRVVI